MPAVPKKRVSKARKRSRRSMWKLTSPQINSCSRCHAPCQPHHMCLNCGHYNGRKVVDMQASEANK